jgi:hypothetical protein
MLKHSISIMAGLMLVAASAFGADQATQSPEGPAAIAEQNINSVTGTVVTVDTTLNRIMIREKDAPAAGDQGGMEGDELARHQVFRIAEDTTVSIDGEEGQLADLRRDDQVRVQVEDDGLRRTVTVIEVYRTQALPQEGAQPEEGLQPDEGLQQPVQPEQPLPEDQQPGVDPGDELDVDLGPAQPEQPSDVQPME